MNSLRVHYREKAFEKPVCLLRADVEREYLFVQLLGQFFEKPACQLLCVCCIGVLRGPYKYLINASVCVLCRPYKYLINASVLLLRSPCKYLVNASVCRCVL